MAIQSQIIIQHIISHGLIYAVATTLLLFIVMITLSPRIWGYHDYPKRIRAKVKPQTKKEKTLAWILFIPFLFVLAFPIISTYWLKAKLGGEISFLIAFANLFVLCLLGTLGDVVILDFIIVNKITPKFVIIPGTKKQDYKDLTHHYIGHLKAAPIIIILCLIAAGIISFF